MASDESRTGDWIERTPGVKKEAKIVAPKQAKEVAPSVSPKANPYLEENADNE